MAELNCPHCGLEIKLQGMAAASLRSCPSCGGELSDAPDAEDVVIDVPAVLLDDVDEVKAEPVFGEQYRSGNGQFYQRGFQFQMREGQQRGVPCCGCGCLILFVLAYLVLRGIGSLF